MDLIGELDDNYIALAMSRPKRRAIVSETRNITFVQPVEIENNVSKRELRLYYITRVLGMAAVTFLIVGAAVLLIMNWDKIMVRDPDTPPVVTTDVTTVTEPSIITTDIDDSSKSNAPTVTFEEMKQMLYYKDNCITLPCSVFDITRLDSLLTASAESGEGSSMYFIKRNDELICSLTVATSGTDVDIPEGKQLISLAIRSGEDFSLFDGKIKLGTTLDEVKALLGEPVHNDEYPDYSYIFTNGGESISMIDMRFDDDGKLTQMPDISYIGLPADSIYAHRTDNSMPEDPFPYNDPDYYYWFYGMWSRNFSTVRNSVGQLCDPEKSSTLDSVNKARNVDTPYTLYDNINLYWYCNWLGISANELCEAIENDNATYLKMQEESGYIPDDALYTDEEINVLRSGSRTELIAQFATEYDIICGEHVFNPEWLYYHIPADYYDAGITPEMVKEKYPLYKQAFSEGDWKMTDEAWAAFDAKLQKYMGMTSDAEETDSNEKDSDRFEQITDTSMADLLTGNYDDDSYDGFLSPWKIEQRGIPIELMRLVDESNTEKWFESIKPLNSGTPYRIDRGYSLYSYITGVGLSWDKAKPILERDFSADEISAMVSGNMELITKNSASEYTIVIGDCAYSPKWLYYHTTDDYTAVGITPGMVGDMLMQYQKLGLPDEMWKAFREKLVLYCTKDLYDESAVKAIYLIETDNAEPFGDRAFEILENQFYGEWELANADELDLFTDLSFTYSKDIFKHEGTPILGIFETDEIYVITYSNFGVGNSYVIKKSEPDVMYEAEIAGYNVGVDAAILTVGAMQNRKYVNRKAAVPGLKSGELSVLGMKKLLHTYGKAFEDCFIAEFEKDKSEGVETGVGTAYSTYKDIYSFGYPTCYLADFTGDTVDMLLPYYYEKDGSYTVIYAVKSFAQNYKGEWDAVNIWTDEGIAPLYGMNDASGATIPVGMLGEFDLDALTNKVFSEDGTFMTELNKFLAGISDKELAAQYRKAFALGTAGCRDMEDYENTDVLRKYYGDDYERSGKRAEIYDKSGAVLGKSSGYNFASVMNAYLHTFSAGYINEVFPQLPFCKCSDELFYRDASMVIPDCYYEFKLSGGEDRAVIAVMGYAKDKATGAKTDEIIYGIEAIFDKTSEGWKCSRFNPHSINQ